MSCGFPHEGSNGHQPKGMRNGEYLNLFNMEVQAQLPMAENFQGEDENLWHVGKLLHLDKHLISDLRFKLQI